MHECYVLSRVSVDYVVIVRHIIYVVIGILLYAIQSNTFPPERQVYIQPADTYMHTPPGNSHVGGNVRYNPLSIM